MYGQRKRHAVIGFNLAALVFWYSQYAEHGIDQFRLVLLIIPAVALFSLVYDIRKRGLFPDVEYIESRKSYDRRKRQERRQREKNDPFRKIR